MRICIDIRTLMDARYSGVSEYTYNLISNILKIDKDNDYCLFYNSYKDVSGYMPVFEGANVEVVKYSYPNKVLNYLLFKPFNLPQLDKRLKADIIFMPHINFIGLSSQSQAVLTIHDLSYLRYPEYFSLRKNIWHKLINVKSLARRCGRIVAVSGNTKNDIVELLGMDESKVSVIPSGLDPVFRRLAPDSSEDADELARVRKKYDLPDKYVLFLGTIEPRKNISGLIEAFSSLCSRGEDEGHDLVIAGMRGWKSRGVFSDWQNSAFKDRIRFTGYVDREEKRALYNGASVFVYPSYYEGFGFPPLESMASGTPVICSSGSSLGEVVGTAALGIDPHNSRDIAVAMAQVLGDGKLRSMLAERGLRQASGFTWQKTAKAYLELFGNLKTN